ncbi:hypothetical protein BBD26_0979 [Lactobacillus delbrueckii subsp. bulgaricus]|nr:hypothetical protein BBD26_0979 [Lactobacillus delbrueckii subsp. bulgaricus]
MSNKFHIDLRFKKGLESKKLPRKSFLTQRSFFLKVLKLQPLKNVILTNNTLARN